MQYSLFNCSFLVSQIQEDEATSSKRSKPSVSSNGLADKSTASSSSAPSSSAAAGASSQLPPPPTPVDPETQARLEALLEAAGIGKLTGETKQLTDPEVPILICNNGLKSKKDGTKWSILFM